MALPNSNIKFSSQFLFSCGGGKCADGWQPKDASLFLKNRGVPLESCMPYQNADIACNSACSNAKQKSQRISSYTTPTNGTRSLAAIKNALKSGPLLTTLSVYDDFMYYSSGTYKHISGPYVGGHAVSIVGYDDNKRAFIIQNSWGANWGENGFAHISYDDTSDLGSSTWKYNLNSKTFAIPPISENLVSTENSLESNPPTKEKILSLSPTQTNPLDFLLVANSATGLKNVKFHMRQSNSSEKTIPVSIKEFELLIRVNSALLKNGNWEIFFTAVTQNNEATESNHEFFDTLRGQFVNF